MNLPSFNCRLCSYAVTLLAPILFAGCAFLSKPVQEVDPRIVKSCTDIRNLTEKNYKISAKFNYVLVAMGFDFERSGIKLSDEAAQHQLDMDRLCRQRATGDISEATWLQRVTEYAAASVATAVRANDPIALEELRANLDEMKAELMRLAQITPQDPSMPGSLPRLDVEKVIADARESTDSAISAKIKSLSEALDSKMQSNSTAHEVKEYQLLVTIAALEKRVAGLEPKPPKVTPLADSALPLPPAWQPSPQFRVKFERGSWELTDEAKIRLSAALKALKRSQEYRIELFGYTDTSGSPVANAALSVARAQEARDFLMDVLELEPSKILAVGRQRSVSKFGSPAENRVVEVRAFTLDVPATNQVTQ